MTAKSLISEVCNRLRNSDLRADNKEVLAAIDRELQYLRTKISDAQSETVSAIEKNSNLQQQLAALTLERDELKSQLNTPEIEDFAIAVVLEAQHQRHRWGSAHDVGKQPEDWFWLVGYLGGKALRAHIQGDSNKALHHTISTAAALANWHAAIAGLNTAMRPGVDPIERGIAEAEMPLELRGNGLLYGLYPVEGH